MKRFLKTMLTLCLVLMLCVSGAWAESTSEETPEYDMFTLTVDNFTISENFSQNTVNATHIPLSIRLGMGMDIDPVRGFLMLALTNTEAEKGLSAIGTVENNAINVHVDGATQDISFSVDEMIDGLITFMLPEGMTIAETTPEFQQALNDAFQAIEDIFAQALAQEDEIAPTLNLQIGNADLSLSLEDADSSIMSMVGDACRSFWTSYPTMMKAVPAGEEEITLFGETYLAKKYTYDTDFTTYEEYLEYQSMTENLMAETDTESSSAMEEAENALSDALNRLMEEIIKMEGGEYTSTPASEIYPDFSANNKGTFYMVEEVLGILDNSSSTLDLGEYGIMTATYQAAFALKDNSFQGEYVSTFSDGQATQFIIRATEQEDGSIEVYAEENTHYDHISFSTESGAKYTLSVTEDKLVFNVNDSSRYLSETVETYSSESDIGLELNHESDDLTTGNFYVTIKNNDASSQTLSADLTLESGMMPEGELLRLSGKPFNPFTATEEEQEALLDSLGTLLTDVINSFIPAPQTAPGVGGALLG